MDWETFKQAAKLILVDDQEVNLSLLDRILKRAGYQHLFPTTKPQAVTDMVQDVHPDIILLDLHMPEMDGFQVMSALKTVVAANDYLPILVLTADITPAAKQRALSEGARDFLSKPLDAIEVVLRINNLLETRMMHQALVHQNEILEEKVRERTRELEEAKAEIMRLLTQW
jgi:putative two-component system response regulator